VPEEMSVLTVSVAQKLAGVDDATQIERLNASNKSTGEVRDLSRCVELVRLDLSHNIITSVGGVASCKSLTWLDVSHNQLESLVGLQQLVNLSVLRASHNHLTTTGDLSNLTNLKALILSHNQLSDLPGVSSLRQLNTLVLSHNMFEFVCVEKLKLLSKLSLSHNSLKAVPDTQKNLMLRELRLNENRIRSLPKSLKHNTKLKILDLGKNKLKDTSVLEPLQSLRHLENLNLRGNQLCDRPSYLQDVLSLRVSLRILDGSRVERLRSAREGAVTTQKKMAGHKLPSQLVKTPTVRSSERSASKRKKESDNVVGVEDVVTETLEEDSTEGPPVRKKKRTHRSQLDSREKSTFDPSDDSKRKSMFEFKSDLDASSGARLNVVKEDSSSLSYSAGVGDTATAGGKVLVSGDLKPSRSGRGLKTSLKAMSKGRSGVVAVKKGKERSTRKELREWDPAIADHDRHQFGSGQSSTWT
jgi:Leucine-rich repeat (LRR) protein